MAARGLIDPGPVEFDATLARDEGTGAACFVTFPHDLKQTYGKGTLVPVKVTFDGAVAYQGSLTAMGGPHAFLLVRKDILAQLGKAAGDAIHVSVELDSSERTITLPADADTALRSNPNAIATWERLSYSHQREYTLWIEEAKRPDTRARRIDKMVEMLADGKRLKS